MSACHARDERGLCDCAHFNQEHTGEVTITCARYEAYQQAEQKLSDARATLTRARGAIAEIYHLIDSDREIKAMKRCKPATDRIAAALAGTPAPVAVPQPLWPADCREDNACWHRSEMGYCAHMKYPSAPDPVRGAYAECARIARESGSSNDWDTPNGIAEKIEAAASRAGVKI